MAVRWKKIEFCSVWVKCFSKWRESQTGAVHFKTILPSRTIDNEILFSNSLYEFLIPIYLLELEYLQMQESSLLLLDRYQNN